MQKQEIEIDYFKDNHKRHVSLSTNIDLNHAYFFIWKQDGHEDYIPETVFKEARIEQSNGKVLTYFDKYGEAIVPINILNELPTVHFVFIWNDGEAHHQTYKPALITD